MYRLLFDGQPVYDPTGANTTDKLIISDPSVTLGVNMAGSVSFSIYPEHPLAGKITRMRGTLELLDDDGAIFRGRIIKDESTFYGAQKFTAEGAMAFLNDAIVDPYVFPDDFTSEPGYAAAAAPEGNVVAWWLGWLLDKYNATAPAARQIRLGTVTVSDPNNYITRENSDYSSTWETISEKLAGSSLGGYLIMRYEDDGNYLDYLADLPRTNPQRVKFAENLLDILIEVTGESTFTAILPVGADGLTLAGLPDGPLEGGLIKAGKVIYDPEAEARYGSRITRVVTWDDVTQAENLQTKAAASLASGVNMPESFTIQACDLSGLDDETPHFRVGQWVQVESEPHGIRAPYPLLELRPNILDPANTVISLNTTAAKFTAAVRQSQIEAAEGARSAIQEASKRFDQIVANASGLYCTPDPQADRSVIYYLHDKKTLEESTLVMKLTAEAIGFSTDGGSTYPYGFTVDGETVMRIISTQGLNAGWINAGILQSLESAEEKAFFLDLEKGILRGHFTELTINSKSVGDIATDAADTAAAGALDEANKYADQAAADAESAANKHADDAAADALKQALAAAEKEAADAVNAQTQTDIFNKLTHNGEDQGIYLRDGKIYINLEYLKTNILDLNRLTLAGTICGLKQGYGSTSSGQTTQGLVMYGNDLNSAGVANPPYLIVTSAGIRGQTGSNFGFNMTNGAFEVLGNITTRAAGSYDGNISAAGNVTAAGYVRGTTFYMAHDGEILAQIMGNGMLQLGGSVGTFLGGNPLYISDVGRFVYIRGNVDFSSANVSGLPDPDYPSSIYDAVSFYGTASMSDLRFKLQNGYFYNMTECDWVNVGGYWVLAYQP